MKKVLIRKLVTAAAVLASGWIVPVVGYADIRSSSAKSVEAAVGSATGDDRKLVAVVKKIFTDPRLSSCKAAARTTPSSSWPARGEPAVAFCMR